MKFKKYNSIENSYQEEFIEKVKNSEYKDDVFVVQEKVHGANLSFISDGNGVVCAKRTELLEKNDDFYNYQQVLSSYNNKVLDLFHHLKKEKGINQLTVFGELFGGGYPHKDVKEIKGVKLVQRGIYYIPQNNFYAFDILIDESIFLDVDEANTLFEKFGFVNAKTLFEGKLNKCLEYSNSFKTTIPKLFNLPEIEGNICEGVVIRPKQSRFFNNGSRVIIKNKNENWSENNNFIDKSLLHKLLENSVPLSKETEELMQEAHRYVSENRLANLISKIGEIDFKKDFGKLIGLFNKDILADFLKDNQERYGSLEKHEAKAVNKFINKQAGQMITDYLKRK